MSPGLAGGYLFDDLVALPALGATGPVDDWPTFWRYITSGTSDPTGRPLALLSFLADARDWPAAPAPFLVTNVLLHLLNACLLYRLLVVLSIPLGTDARRNSFAALLATGLWVLHPLQVSTVLYVVQREAVLCTTFVLAGLLLYARGRRMLAIAPRRGLGWMTAGIAGGTLLALMCKANGILLPLLAAVLEATVFRRLAAAPAHRALTLARLVLLLVPTVLLVAYIAALLPELSATNARPWTISQRALTEPRILFDYLRLLVVPRVLSSGLYNDDYQVSLDLFHPAGTVLAAMAVAALGGGAIAFRRHAPALSAAILFFLAGHVLESTVLPLELYFEHRNYLPSLLLFWPFARLCSTWPPGWARAGAAVALAVAALLTWQRAALWSQPRQMAALWAQQQSGSSRAQATLAAYEVAGGDPARALHRLDPLWTRRPADIQLAVNYVDAACALGGLSPRDATRMATALQHARDGGGLIHAWLADQVSGASSCGGVDDATLANWLAAARANPALARAPGRRQDLHSLDAMLALRRGSGERALAGFNRALDALPDPGVAAAQAALLGARGFPALGLRHLEHAEVVLAARPRRPALNMSYLHDRVLDRQAFWPRELDALRAQLQSDAHARQYAP